MAGETPWDVQLAVPDGSLVVTGDAAVDREQVPAQVKEAIPGRGRPARLLRKGLTNNRLSRDPGAPEASLDHLRAELATELSIDEYPPRVEAVQLGIGRGLRMEAVRRPSDIDGEPQRLRLVVQYWVPVEQDEVVELVFTTSNLGRAGELAAEFQVIAENLSYTVEAPEPR